MIPAPFDYVAPRSVAECVAALHDDARVLAGGSWVLPELGRGESSPRTLVDLRHAGLGSMRPAAAGGLHVGAMATYTDLAASAQVRRGQPLLAAMAGGITGGWALRNQATVGGSAAAARPQSEAPAVLTACDASVVVAGPAGERILPARELFRGAMRTMLAPREIITGFEVPDASGARHGYVKLKRGASSWPIATAAASLWLDPDGVCRRATLVLGGVCATPVSVELGDVLVGRVCTPDLLRKASERARETVAEPWGDVLAPADYRRQVSAPVARRVLERALSDAPDEAPSR